VTAPRAAPANSRAVVRAARSADVACIEILDGATSASPLGAARLAAACIGEHGQGLLVLPVDARIEGFVLYAVRLDEGSIYRIAVAAACRRRGFGGALLDAALAAQAGAGAARCLLEVRASNRAARRLYTARGFRLDGRRRNYYACDDRREDALLLSREV